MQTLLALFREKIADAMNSAFSSPFLAGDIAPCPEEFGHYQCNSALRLSKIFKQNPKAIAEKIISHFDASICSKVEIAGPGFINFTPLPLFSPLSLKSN